MNTDVVVEKKAYRIDEIVAMFPISRATLYREHHRNRIAFIKEAGCVLIASEEWNRYWKARIESKLFVSQTIYKST